MKNKKNLIKLTGCYYDLLHRIQYWQIGIPETKIESRLIFCT